MIIELTGADFSANNLGQIQVVIPTQDETTAILAKFSTTPTTAVSTALNKFIYTLKSAEILTKIKAMFMPFLAANVTEACQNLAGNSTIKNQGSLVLTDKGLKYTSESSTPSTSWLSGEVMGTANNYHVSVYNTITHTSGTSQAVGMFAGMYYFSTVGVTQGIATKTATTASVYSLSGDATKKNAVGCASLSVVSENTLRIAKNGLSNTFALDELKDSNISGMSLCGYGANGGTVASSNQVKEPIGFMTFGSALTATEQDLFNNAVNQMMAVVLA